MTHGNRPKVSILLPFRNEADYLEACLISLARQKDVSFELVGINDGSTDRSAEIFSSMAGRFSGVKLVSTEGVGIVEALNRGAAAAEGVLFARADGDDLYHPRRLALQIALLEAGADMVGSATRFFPRTAVQGGFRTYERWINGLVTHEEMEREIFVENPIPHPTLAVTRTLFERLGGYRENSFPEDWDIVLRAIRAGAKMAKVDRCLHYWREHDDRLCRHHPNYSQRAFIHCRCHHLARGPLADGRSVIIWGAGPLGRKMTTALRREGVAVDGFIDIDPKKIGRIVRDRPVHPASWLEVHRPFVLGCVGKRGARYDIRAALTGIGYVEGIDFLLAA
jgi:glycosyltransferase involved in cell wall biosynthesis